MKKIGLYLLAMCFAGSVSAQTSPANAPFTETPVSAKTFVGSVSGTLAIPNNVSGKVPVVLIVPGTGPTNREGNNAQAGISANTYLILAAELAKNGYASLRYDKHLSAPGITKNQEDGLRFDDYVEDAVTMINTLTTDQRFSSIIILGHGDGSLAGMLACKDEPIKAFISVEGAGEPAYKIMTEQTKNQAGFISDGFNRMLDSLKKGKYSDDIDPALYSVARPSIQKYLVSWFAYDPALEIKRLKMPILIVQGTTDLQITVAEAEKLKKAKSDAILSIIPNMNYILKDAPADKTQNKATYNQPDLPLKPEFVTALIKFLGRVTK